MTRVLDRYVFRELVSPFFIGVGLFTFFLTIDRIYSLTDLVVTKGVPFYLVLQLLVYMLPSFLVHTLPMALLVAVLLAAGRLASDLEVVAFNASGVGPVRLFLPFLAAAIVVTAMTAALTLLVNPWSNRAFQWQLFKILQTRAATGIKERVFSTTFGQFVIYVEEVSPSQVGLRGLLVADERDPKLVRIITARQGRLFTDEENKRITLRLIDGAIQESDADNTVRYRRTAFGMYDMNLAVESPFTGAPRVEKPEKDLGIVELVAAEWQLAREGQSTAPYLVEFHKRLTLPVAAIVFILVGFPLAIRSHRGGRGIALVGSLVIVVTYYLLLTSLESVALSRRLTPWVAIWTPTLLFTLVGLVLLRSSAVRVPAGWANLLWRLRVLVAPRAAAPGRAVSRRRPRRIRGPQQSSHLMDRYLVREFLMYLGLGVGVGAALFVVVDLLQTLDRYLRTKPPVVYILEHFIYRLPAGLYQGLPVIVLVSTIFLFLALSRQHELTALKAAGVSLYRVSLPILLLAFAVSVGSVVFQETVLPFLNTKGEEVDRIKIRGELPRHLQRRTQIWYRSSESRFFRVDLLDPGGRQMDGVMVLEIDRNFRLLNRLDAARAYWSSRGWEFERGAFREFAPDGTVESVPFVLTSLELPETLDDFIQIQKPADTMSFRELRAYMQKLQESGHQIGKYVVQLYSKLSFPLVHVIMALVAIPFALQWPRGGRIIGVALAIALSMGYWVVNSLALSFAKADLLPPLLAAWAANIVFAGLGISLFLRART
ncbi:MAG: LPS export ABC transporter permease LptG [Candidatus Rokubacteria bacterium]|nr:LPS export ABC transporter permease LptG [Candidatus Rokubacteria bacterium]